MTVPLSRKKQAWKYEVTVSCSQMVRIAADWLWCYFFLMLLECCPGPPHLGSPSPIVGRWFNSDFCIKTVFFTSQIAFTLPLSKVCSTSQHGTSFWLLKVHFGLSFFFGIVSSSWMRTCSVAGQQKDACVLQSQWALGLRGWELFSSH